MRKLFFFFFILPVAVFAQITDDFEDGDISNWTESTVSKWEASSTSPLNGTYSLRHFDSNDASTDRISIALPSLNLGLGTIFWQFQIKHGWNPSNSNNWAVFLMSDADATEMISGGNISGYAIGVNLNSSDDMLKLWKADNGSFSSILETTINWQTDIGTSTAVGIEVTRDQNGNWSVKINNNENFENFVEVGTINDIEFTFDNHFGIYYEYTISADTLFWFDNLSIFPNVDSTANIINPSTQVESNNISSIANSKDEAINVLKFQISDIANFDSYETKLKKIRFKNSNPANSADWSDNIKGVVLKENSDTIHIDSITITETYIDIYIPEDSLVIENNSTKEITCSIYLNETNISDGSKIQLFIDADDHGWKTWLGTQLQENFTADIISNIFTINIEATELSLSNYNDSITINSNFSLTVSAVDVNNNIDTDNSSTVNIELGEGTGNLTTSSFQKELVNGEISWNDLKYNELGEFKIRTYATGFTSDTTEIILAVGNNDSYIDDPDTQIASNTISSLTSEIEVFKFKIIDAGSGDLLDTKVKQIVIKNANPVNSCNWIETIDSVTIASASEIIIDSLVIEQDSIIMFFNENDLLIADGTEDEFTISLLLNSENIIDNSQFQCEILNINHDCLTYEGSSFLDEFPGSISSNTFTFNVDATEIRINHLGSLQFKDSLFSSDIIATDEIGNIDLNFNQTLTISENFGEGNLSTSLFTNTFINGITNWNDLIYDNNVVFELKYSNSSLDDLISDTIYCIDLHVFDDFESGNLDNWQSTNDWLVSNEDSINGNFSLKHNITGTSDTSYILQQVADIDIETGTYIWRFNLKNGNFDPSSSNMFAYYLMADDSINADSVNAYVVGVNLQGSDDLLSLWYIKNGEVNDRILSSNFDWDKNDFVGIEVHRENDGNWLLNYDTTGNFDNFTATEKSKHTKLTGFQYTGLKFQFTTSYGGMFWFDDLSAGLMNTAPKIKNIDIIATDTLLIQITEEITQLSAENISNYSITPDSTDAVNITGVLLQADNKTVKLIVDELVTDNYSLQISNIEDVDGLINISQTYNFRYILPANYGDAVITEIMADPSPSAGLPEYEYFELFNNTSYDIPLENWMYIVGNDTNTFSELVIKPNNYLIITSSSGADTLDYYGNVYAGIGSTDLTNAGKSLKLISHQNTLIYDVTYSDSWYNDDLKEDGGYSLEILNPDNFCSTFPNWSASTAEIGGTPGTINSVDSNYVDNIAPTIAEYSIYSDSIQLVFSELIDTISAKTLSNYILNNGIGNPVSIHIYDDLKTIDLHFDEALQDETDYILLIKNIEDECENSEAQIEISFTFYIPKKYDIVVTEIMADPSPAVGLPAYEYLELYNKSDYNISLKNWQVKVGEKTRTISDYILNSNEYLIITSSSGADTLAVFGTTYVGIGSSDLTNAGNTIQILNQFNDTIYEVIYSDAWYKDEDKEDGGWSLEIRNPENICSTNSNWSASNAELGGTPGAVNSIDSDYQDIYPPELLENNLLTNNTIQLIYNEQLDSASVYTDENFNINNGIGNPSSIFLDEDNKTIEISFEQAFVDEASYILTITTITDECGNYNDTIEVEFQFYLAKKFDVVFTEIMADPEPQVDLPAVDFLEIYNRSDFEINLANWQIEIGDAVKVFENISIASNEYLILTSSSAESQFGSYGNVLGIIGSSDLTTTGKNVALKDQQGIIIDSIFYNKYWYHDTDKDDGGWTIEKIDAENTCSSLNNWTASIDPSGGTPGKINSVYNTYIDEEKPTIERVKAISQFKLEIDFNEFLDIESASNLLKYNVDNNIGNPSYFLHSGIYASSIQLTFTDVFENGKEYTLYVSGLKDECGNLMNDTSIVFTYYYVNINDIVFTEIMFDPSPVVGLPEYEYIEIFNRTEENLEISGWQLSIDESLKDIPDFTLAANDYIILCSRDADSIFSEFTNSVGVSGFPSLNNTSEKIALIDTSGREINAVTYFNYWYKDDEKADGGYSIEKIDPDNFCSTTSNWKASEDENGGTPGLINSVDTENVDNISPQIMDVFVISPQQIQIAFSEIMDSITLSDKTFYTLENNQHPDSIYFDPVYFNNVNLYFYEADFAYNSAQLSIFNLTDECGNLIDNFTSIIEFYEPAYNEVVINEIMFDFEAVVELPEAEYIELYNPSLNQISFVNTEIYVETSHATLPNFNIAPNEYLILTDKENASLFNQYGKVIAIDNLPSLSNSGAQITIKCNDGKIFSVIEYSDDWIDDPFKQNGGWSLELVDPTNPSGNEENWQVSDDESGGTPGRQNSVFAENPDQISPQFKRVAVVNDSALLLIFSETIDTVILHPSYFTVDHSVGNPEIIDPVEPQYNKVIIGFNQSFDFGNLYEVTVSETIQDISGNSISGNLSQYFSIPSPVDSNSIVINEILFNPANDGVDYIEIYNKSLATFDLKNMFLATKDLVTKEFKSIYRINEEGFLILPESYLVLTTNPDIVKQQYYTSNPDNFVEMNSFPSLPNDEGIICLTDSAGNVIDELYFSDNMHFQILTSTDGVSLERLNFNWATADKSNWHSAAEQVGFGTPAYENSQFTESKETSGEIALQNDVFSPDNDGFDDILLIDYHFNQPGNTANCYIFNAKGIEVRHLLNNELLATNGTFSWDGLNNDNNKVSIGIYILYFEIFDTSGNVKNIKKTCVVASKL